MTSEEKEEGIYIKDLAFDYNPKINKFVMSIQTNVEVMEIRVDEADFLALIKAMIDTIWRTKGSDSLKDLI